MIQNDLVSSAFRADLDRPPTRAEFAEAARSMNMLAVPWVDAVDVANAALFLASDEALHHRDRPARRRRGDAAMRAALKIAAG
jgi:hypothetical protein